MKGVWVTMGLLDLINKENDIKKIAPDRYPALAGEIRGFLLDKLSKTGGHVSANLGSVELTMALHICMDLPKDKIIFDVGHQSYTHKILTGRKDGFDHLRQLGGMSGFPKGCESDCDAFDTGHSSTSISAALGIAMAAKLRHAEDPDYPVTRVAAVIGDGAMTGGMAYEALDAAGQLKAPMVVVLNDNEMSIGKNVGGISKTMNRIRVGRKYNELKNDVKNAMLSIPSVGEPLVREIKKSKASLKNLLIPGMIFEEMGITYIGPIDGHNVEEMVMAFERAFRLRKPIIVHVKTVKGKGYGPAEKHPERFHGIGPFDLTTGYPIEERRKTFTDVFAKKLLTLGETRKDMVVITAAMARGTGVAAFQKAYPDRTFDVGIAEQHAVTFAAGLAKTGLLPVVAIYSSFLQRAYDQILHDVCLQDLHVIFAIDRSGLVGEDGETHQGIYDSAYLEEMPNMTVLAPANGEELKKMMDFALEIEGPVAIKYPKGSSLDTPGNRPPKVIYGKSTILYDSESEVMRKKIKDGKLLQENAGDFDPDNDDAFFEKEEDLPPVTFIAVGCMNTTALEVSKKLTDEGIPSRVVNARFVRPMDREMLKYVAADSRLIVVIEESVVSGSFGAQVAYELMQYGVSVPFLHIGIEEEIVRHGSVSEQRELLGLDADNVLRRVHRALKA